MTAAAVAGALALTGCGGVAVQKDASYRNIGGLGDAVKSVIGESCGGANRRTIEGDWDQDNCGKDVSISVFADPKTQKSVRLKNPADAGKNLLEGPNWIIWATVETSEKLRDKLGGSFQSTPEKITASVTVTVTNPWRPRDILRVNDNQGPGRWCYGSADGMFKDLGPDSEASVMSATGMFKSGKLTNSSFVDGGCKMTYMVQGVTAADGPYKVQVGGREAGESTEAQIRAGLELTIGK